MTTASKPWMLITAAALGLLLVAGIAWHALRPPPTVGHDIAVHPGMYHLQQDLQKMAGRRPQ